MRQTFSTRVPRSTAPAGNISGQPKVIPFSRSTAAISNPLASATTPSLWRRVGAEAINRVVPWFLILPLVTLPLAIFGGQNYLLPTFLLWLSFWHLCCDGMPQGASPGKRLFFLRLAALPQSACLLRQKVLRRSIHALSQSLYSLVFALSLPTGAVQSQAEMLTGWLLTPLHWFGYTARATALLMFLALLLDGLNLLCLALSEQGRSLGDWLAGTCVISGKTN